MGRVIHSDGMAKDGESRLKAFFASGPMICTTRFDRDGPYYHHPYYHHEPGDVLYESRCRWSTRSFAGVVVATTAVNA